MPQISDRKVLAGTAPAVHRRLPGKDRLGSMYRLGLAQRRRFAESAWRMNLAARRGQRRIQPDAIGRASTKR